MVLNFQGMVGFLGGLVKTLIAAPIIFWFTDLSGPEVISTSHCMSMVLMLRVKGTH